MLSKKTMLTTFVAFMMPIGLWAATAAPPVNDKATKPHGQYLAKALNLTPEQTTKLKAMLQQHKQAMTAEKERFESQVNGLLTPEQQAKFKELQEKRMERRRHHHGGFMMGLEKLNLSPDQQAQVKKIMEDKRAKLADVPPGDFAARKQVWQDTRAQLEKVLTPEQLQQWDQMKQEWKARHHGKTPNSP